MVKVKEDLTGQTFGRLTVLRQYEEDHIFPNGDRAARWVCQCSCSDHKIIVVIGKSLKSGNTTNCGCVRREKTSAFWKEYNKKENKYNLDGDYGIGWTNNTGSEFYFDLEDYALIKDYCWFERIQSDGYRSLMAWDSSIKKHIKFHYLLNLGYEKPDHIDRNALNNRRSNLRPANSIQNAENRSLRRTNKSGITGVFWHANLNKWEAYICYNYNRIRLGFFDNKEDAIVARLKGERQYFSDGFEPQRHLFEQYGII